MSHPLEQRLADVERLLLEILALVEGDQLLNEQQAAELRHLSVFALRRERHENRGPVFIRDPHTGAIRYRRADVRAYVALGEVRPRRQHEPDFSKAVS